MCEPRASSFVVLGVSALAWLLLPGCSAGQTQHATVRGTDKLEESQEALETRAGASRFTPVEIASIEGAEDEDGGLRLGESLLFDEGSASLKTSAFTVLDGILALLGREHPGEAIVIEGHTDYQPRRKKAAFRPSMDLGYSRARSVVTYFFERGVPESRMQLMSYSDSKPLDPLTAYTAEGRRANRRAVIRLAPAEA